jgi:hypothetical protein
VRPTPETLVLAFMLLLVLGVVLGLIVKTLKEWNRD